MNHAVAFTRKNYTWGNMPHLELVFPLLLEQPLAATMFDIERQFNDAFRRARNQVPDNKKLPQCPSAEKGTGFDAGSVVCVTKKELVIFGRNGALMIMRNDDIIDDDLAIIPATCPDAATLKKDFTVCYERAGADGCNVWGEPFMVENSKAA